jgi:calcium-translocating P-type ATPase
MERGLTSQEAEKRLKEHGPNLLPEAKGRGLVQVFFEQFKNPLIYLLVAAAMITFFFGKASDPIVVLGVALINAIVGTFQEGRAEKSLKALRKYTQLKVKVLRDGSLQEILSRDLVPGDFVSLVGGDLVPADGILVEAVKFQVSEAVLTGESVALAKGVEARVFSGTHVQMGRGLMRVERTGKETELGKIAELAERAPTAKTPIEERMTVFGKQLALLAIGVALFLLVGGWMRALPRAELIMAAASELVSIIPEGLPVAITIALAVGVQRMAAKKAVVRKLVAVETLGSMSVICSDKTGTLTKNEMVVREFFPKSQELVEALLLCNDASLEAGDPLEVALLAAAQEEGMEIAAVQSRFPRVAEIPFSSEEKMMATEHEGGLILIKGAFERIESLCHVEIQQAREMAKQGFRVLACAKVVGAKIDPDKGFEQFSGKAQFLGVVSLYDPPRPEAMQAIASCQQAGIRTVMVTGDYLETALAIARELNLMREGDIAVSGDDLEKMSLEELQEKCEQIAVFARVHPGQKYKIVEAFQKRGEVVAMTGDGVNDAPALAKADVGVAMGKTGTDVAKEAAKMVILDDNFATIAKAVAEGRLVYQNLKKVIFYLLATSLAGAFALLMGIIFGLPLVMNPLHILWINVVTEGTVTINLILDPLFGDEMQRPPVKRRDPILERAKVFSMIVTILWIGGLLLAVFFYQEKRNHLPIEYVQTQVFTLFAFCAWFKLLSVRVGERSALNLNFLKNRYLAIGLALSVVLHLAVLYLPILNRLFHTVPLSAGTLGVLLLLASTTLFLDELRKFILSLRHRRR